MFHSDAVLISQMPTDKNCSMFFKIEKRTNDLSKNFSRQTDPTILNLLRSILSSIDEKSLFLFFFVLIIFIFSVKL